MPRKANIGHCERQEKLKLRDNAKLVDRHIKLHYKKKATKIAKMNLHKRENCKRTQWKKIVPEIHGWHFRPGKKNKAELPSKKPINPSTTEKNRRSRRANIYRAAGAVGQPGDCRRRRMSRAGFDARCWWERPDHQRGGGCQMYTGTFPN